MYTHFTFTLMAHCTSGAIRGSVSCSRTLRQGIDLATSNLLITKLLLYLLCHCRHCTPAAHTQLFAHTHTHTHKLFAHTHSYSLSLTHTNKLSFSLSHTHIYLSLTHTHTHTHKQQWNHVKNIYRIPSVSVVYKKIRWHKS